MFVVRLSEEQRAVILDALLALGDSASLAIADALSKDLSRQVVNDIVAVSGGSKNERR